MPDLNAAARLSQQAQKELGLPAGFSIYSPFPFAGINQQASRIGIADQEFRWRENFIKIGDGNLRTTPDSGSALYTGTGFPAIVYFFWYNIGPTNYVAVFFSDGTAIQIDGDLGTQTVISNSPGTFFTIGGPLPACVSWGSQYLLIANNNNFNDYWIWDGTLLYTAGSVGPIIDITDIGNNYSSVPTVVAYGGQGSGVSVVATILNGSILTLKVTNQGSGFVPGDNVQLQFSGGGSDTGAILTADLNSGGVSSVSITNGGTGYTTATVTFSAPTGTQATANAILFHGHVAEVVITNPGGGYTAAPAVTFTGGGGSGAHAHATVTNGQVVQIIITDEGSGYSSPPTVNIAAPTGAVTATGTAETDGNAVTGVTITNPGAGYTSAPTVTFGGPGTGATGVAFLGSSSVVGVTVVEGGSGYTFPPTITFVGGQPHTIAEGTVVLTATSVGHVNVTNGGGPGYTSAPTVNFNNNQTSGSGAAGTALIEGGRVIGVNLTNGGSGYTLPPFITFTGGGLPTGVPQATAEAILKGTSIASVIMSQQGTGYTQAPAVVIAPGANNAANAIMEMMPFGVSGSGIESYQQRVWIDFPKPRTSPTLTGNVFQVTAPGSLTDFATSDGGLIFKSNSPFLRAAYTTLKTVGDFLYPIGDSSVDVISNVQTSGNPPTTTFNYNNTDPQTGTNWRETVRDFSRTALFANKTGVYGLYGGAVTKLSEKLDDLFQTAHFPPDAGSLIPSAAVAEIYKRKVFLLLMTITDPFTNAPRNVMASWDEQDWFITSQVDMPLLINTRVVNGVPTAWGTDGTSLFPLFQNPSSSLNKILQTKLYGAQNFPAVKLALSLHITAEDKSGGTGIVMNGTMDTENAPYPLPLPLNFGAGISSTPIIAGATGDVYGCFLGLTLNSSSPDFTLKHLSIGYSVWWGGWGSPPQPGR